MHRSERGTDMKVNVTRTAVVRSRWAAVATVTLFATACSTGSNTSGVTATSSTGGTTTSTSDETTTTTSTPDETTTSTSVETTTSASETTLPGELSAIPPIVAGDGTTLYYYDHLSNSPPVTIGPLTEPDHYLLSPDGRYAAVEHSGDAIRKARLEIVATDTGTPVLSIDFDADGVTASAWSPDSTAVLAAPRSTTNVSSAAVYRIDGTSQPLTGDALCADSRQELLWVQGGSGVTVLQSPRAVRRSRARSRPRRGAVSPTRNPSSARSSRTDELGQRRRRRHAERAADDATAAYADSRELVARARTRRLAIRARRGRRRPLPAPGPLVLRHGPRPRRDLRVGLGGAVPHRARDARGRRAHPSGRGARRR